MPRNGSGTYARAVSPYVNGTIAEAPTVNTEMNDIAAALTQSLSKDGQTTPTGNLPMGSNRHTGVGNAAARSDYAAAGQVQDSAFLWCGTAGGTANALTLSPSPAITAYAAGQTFRFKSSSNANTSTTTVAISGLPARAIQNNGAALAGGEIAASLWYEILYDGAAFQLRPWVAFPVPDSTALVAGSSDATKKLRIEVDTNVTTTTTRVLTVPSADGTFAVTTNADGSVTIPTQLATISATVSSNALTIGASSLVLDFRSSTLTSGAVTRVSGSPSNLVISSGSTLGTINATQSRIAVLAINNAGTIELAAVNISGGNDLTETGVISTTAEGGAGGADSSTVIYSTTARSNVAYRVIGYVESTQTTAGTWATTPSTIQGYGGNAVNSMSSIGYGQTWQNVSGSRAASTTYYNTTGRPIQVIITSAAGNPTTTSTFLVNGVTIQTASVSGTGVTSVVTIGGIVPPGASYSETGAFSTWFELR